MKKVKLTDIISKVRENGHIGWIKVVDASKIVSNTSGYYQIANTIFKQKFVNKSDGDEILTFGNKQINITELENELSRFNGLEINIFAGAGFNGILQVDLFSKIKKKLNITDDDISKMFSYKSKSAYANSSAKNRIEKGLVSFYKKIKRVDG